jgi:hypothetical protein
MRFRKLRIAWSVGWGLVAVLLIVLWVRSYEWDDLFPTNISPTSIMNFRSRSGTIKIAFGSPSRFYPRTAWQLESQRKCPAWQNPDPLPNRFGFGTLQIGANFVVRLPHWFCCAFFILAAAILWLPTRFSLRTLLIAMTLVAVVLGLIVYAVR